MYDILQICQRHGLVTESLKYSQKAVTYLENNADGMGAVFQLARIAARVPGRRKEFADLVTNEMKQRAHSKLPDTSLEMTVLKL